MRTKPDFCVSSVARTGLLALTLLSAGAGGADAQVPTTLSLSSPVTAAQEGQQVTFTVLLNGGANMSGYDFNVYLNSPLLSFGSSGFTFNGASGFVTTAPFAFSTITGSQLEASSAALPGSAVGPQAMTPLGTFTVMVTGSPTTADLTQITFGAIGNGFNGGSEVEDAATAANILTATTPASLMLLPTAAPEPSGALAGMTGLAGLGLLAWRAKRRASACSAWMAS